MNDTKEDWLRMGIGVAVQTIDEMARIEGDPTTQLARVAQALRECSAMITTEGLAP